VETYKKYLDSMSVENIQEFQECQETHFSKPAALQSAKAVRSPAAAKSAVPIKFFEKLLRKRPNFRKKTAEKTPKSLGKS
jgi:Rieske Fe-S protein